MWGGGCRAVGVVRWVWGGECVWVWRGVCGEVSVGVCGCGEVSVSEKVGLAVERWCECGCGEVVGVLI